MTRASNAELARPPQNELGSLVRSAREARQISQKLCAAELGVSQPYLSDIETGRRSSPTHQLLVSLSDYLGIPLHAVAAAAGARIEAHIPRSADQIAEYLHTQLVELVEQLDAAQDEISNRNEERLRILLDSAKARAQTFLIIVRRARGQAQNRLSRADAKRAASPRVGRSRKGDRVRVAR